MSGAARVRTPERRQVRRTECLAASIGIVLAYYGRHVPAADLRAACGVGRNGATVGDAVRAARGEGLEVRALRTDGVEALRALAPPLVVYLDHNHAVVVEGVGDDRVWLNDPAAGRRSLSRDAFDARFTGLALTFRPASDFRRQRAVPEPDPLGWTFRERRGATALAALAAVAGGLVALAVVFRHEPVLALGIAAGALVCWALSQTLGVRVRARVAGREADVLSAWLLGRPPRAHLAQSDDLNAALLAGMDGPERLLDALGTTAFWLGAGAGAVVGVAAAGHGALAAALAVGIVATCAEPWRMRRVVRAQRGFPHAASPRAAPRLVDRRDGTSADRAREGWARAIRQDTAAALRAVETAEAEAPWALARRAAIASGPALALTLAPAALPLALVGAAASSWAPALAWTWTPLQTLWSHRRTLFDDPAPPGPRPRPTPLDPELTFDDVTFAFSTRGPLVLDGVSLRLRPGEVVAIVGPSGEGKSTLAALASGAPRPTSGAVRLGGVDVTELTDADRAAVLGVVPQRPVLWPSTVRDLVRLDRDLDDGSLREALARAGVVLSLDATVGADGEPLSRNERAAIGLARTEVGRPPLVLLDETLDALGLDAATRVLAEMRAEGRGVLVVTHEPAIARLADRVGRLSGGRLILSTD